MGKDVRLMLGDCVAMTRTLDHASIDLVLTSPPYDKLRAYASGSAFDFEALADECKRVLKPGGVLVWVVGDQTKDGDESGSSFRQALHFKSIGLKLRDTMIWRKSNPMPCGDRSHYLGVFEFMFVLTKGKPGTTNVLREPCTQPGRIPHGTIRDHGRPIRPRDADHKPVNADKPRPNVWTYAVVGDTYGHPAVFPLQLAIDHVLSWTDEGDTVLDPFAGSGTTGEACLKTGRKFVGVEISPEYLEIARKRLDAAQAERSSMLPFERAAMQSDVPILGDTIGLPDATI